MRARVAPALGLLVAACGARTGTLDLATVADAGSAGAQTDAATTPDLTCPGAPGVEPGAPWPMPQRCPGRTSSSPVVGPTTTPHVAWSAGSDVFEIVIGADETIYAADAGHLTAFSPDGAWRWQIPRGPAASGLAIGRSGTIYAFYDGALHAIRPDGSLAWTTTSPMGGPASLADLDLGADETIYVRYRWTGIGPAPMPSDAAGLAAVTPAGDVKWKVSLPPADILGAPHPDSLAVGPDGTIDVTAASMDRGANSLLALSPAGALLWRHAIGTMGDPVVAGDGTIYVGGDHGLAALSPAGATLWTQADGRAPPAVVAPDGTVYTGSAQHSIDALAGDGSTRWTYTEPYVSGNGQAFVVGGDGTLYATANGYLEALSRDGTLLWHMLNVGRPAALGADGTLYTIADPPAPDQGLTALRP